MTVAYLQRDGAALASLNKMIRSDGRGPLLVSDPTGRQHKVAASRMDIAELIASGIATMPPPRVRAVLSEDVFVDVLGQALVPLSRRVSALESAKAPAASAARHLSPRVRAALGRAEGALARAAVVLA